MRGRRGFMILCGLAGALASFATLANDRAAAWDVLMDAGMAATEARDLATAREKFEQALALARGEPADPAALASSLNGLGACLSSLGQYDEATRLLDEAYALLSKEFGADHPKAVPPLNNLAAIYGERGQYDRAGEILEKTLAIERQAYGDTSADVGETRIRLGNLYTRSGKLAAAEAEYAAAVRVFEAAEGPSAARSLRRALAVQGNLYRELAQPEKALACLERVEQLREAGAAPDFEDVTARVNLGALMLDRRQFERALTLLRQSLSELKAFLPPEHVHFGQVQLNIGAAEASLGRLDRAEQSFATACRIFDAALPPAHPDRLRCLKHHARALDALGRKAEAAAVQQRLAAVAGPPQPAPGE